MKLKIGCTDWNIIFEDTPNEGGEVCRGVCRGHERTISLATHLSDTRLMETFLHECLHAIDDEYRIGLDEKQVNVLGVTILDFIRTNKIDFLA